MVPYWSLGFQLCRWGYRNLTHMQTVVSEMRAYDIPHVSVGYLYYLSHYYIWGVSIISRGVLLKLRSTFIVLLSALFVVVAGCAIRRYRLYVRQEGLHSGRRQFRWSTRVCSTTESRRHQICHHTGMYRHYW